jgi:phosphohistidine phosphatase
MTERSLVLLRHGKAGRPDGVADVDRPLTARGHADAAAAGAWIAHSGYSPDLVICSPAKRTRQAWHGAALGMAAAAGLTGTAGSGAAAPAMPPVVRYEADMYAGSARDLLRIVRAVGPEVSTVLLIGHNPTISELSALLDPTGSGDPAGLRTSGIAVHRLGGKWQDCTPAGTPRTACHTARG